MASATVKVTPPSATVSVSDAAKATPPPTAPKPAGANVTFSATAPTVTANANGSEATTNGSASASGSGGNIFNGLPNLDDIKMPEIKMPSLDEIKVPSMDEMGENMKKSFSNLGDNISGIWTSVSTTVTKTVKISSTNGEDPKTETSTTQFTEVKQGFQKGLDQFTGIFDNVKGAIGKMGDSVQGGINSGLSSVGLGQEETKGEASVGGAVPNGDVKVGVKVDVKN